MINVGRVFRRYRSLISWICFIAVIAAVCWLVSSPKIVGAASVTRSLPVYCVDRSDKLVAISFDAAWGSDDTMNIIDILEKHGVKTTFFLVGDWVDKYPECVKALADAGHEVMNHSSKHDHFSKLSSAEIQADLQKCNSKIEAITGKTPTLVRCPYGEYDDHVIDAINDIGMTAIQWSVDSLDWKGLSASEITERVLSRVEPGSIVLFHNAADHTPEALPGIIEALQADGYTIVPISEILLNSDYTIDHTGKQIAAS